VEVSRTHSEKFQGVPEWNGSNSPECPALAASYGPECVNTEKRPAMRCAYGGVEFAPKNVRGRFCSARCRAAAWSQKRHDKLACLEDQAARLVIGLRALRGKS
jgi:hypothetical protein